MKKILITLSLLVFSFTAHALTNEYNNMVFFGDSLTDNGNLYHFTWGFIPKSPPYFEGRFSNGTTWAEKTAQYFSSRFNISSANYAVGGETTVFHNPADGFLPYTLTESVDDYLFRTAYTDRSKTLFIIWIGANDYLPQTKVDDSLTESVTSTINDDIEKLISKGGKNFLLVNLPDLAKTPRGREGDNQAVLAELTRLHNEKLAAVFNNLKNKYPEINLQFFGVGNLFDDIVANPEAYNQKYHVHITDTTQSCWLGSYTLQRGKQLHDSIKQRLEKQKIKMNLVNSNIDTNQLADAIMQSPSLFETYVVTTQFEDGVVACPNADEHLFWDHVHPTEITHYLLSKAFIELINDKFTPSTNA